MRGIEGQKDDDAREEEKYTWDKIEVRGEKREVWERLSRESEDWGGVWRGLVKDDFRWKGRQTLEEQKEGLGTCGFNMKRVGISMNNTHHLPENCNSHISPVRCVHAMCQESGPAEVIESGCENNRGTEPGWGGQAQLEKQQPSSF